MTGSARQDKRYKASHPLQVRCDSWGDFVQLYAGDVSQGGMFILTEEPHEMMSEVDVRMKLPEGHHIELRGRIVHVMTREMAEAEGRKPGVGVEFKNLTKAMKQQIVQLIEYARWEGAGGDPSASYASRMFETAQHQSVAEVLSNIQGAPGAPPTPSRTPAQPGPRTTSRVKKVRPDGASASQSPSGRPRNSDRSVASKMPSDPDRSMAGKLPSDPDMSLTGNFPSDPIRLKEAMQLIARKRYGEALKVLQAMLEETPQDVNARKWLHLTQARDFMHRKEIKAGIQAYEQALTVDEKNHEAREAVRNHYRNKRLNAIPFGRYFVKKK